MLEDILNALIDGQKYLCITRPRRFGKSVMANMIGAFLGKASDSGSMFYNFAVMKKEDCKKHLNRHNVIFIDFSRVPRGCSSYFGFTKPEVDQLFDLYNKSTKSPKITREDLRLWYDGYYTASGEQLYNPRSVVCALANNQLVNFVTFPPREPMS